MFVISHKLQSTVDESVRSFQRIGSDTELKVKKAQDCEFGEEGFLPRLEVGTEREDWRL